MTTWKSIERPGYMGKHRDELFLEYDARFGAGNWRLAWKIGEVWGGFLAACRVYEDAYLRFFMQHRGLLADLAASARDVFDDDPVNVESGLDYGIQSTGRTHLQDIAIRNCFARLGVGFSGADLIQIRTNADHGFDNRFAAQLVPHRVPFHRPNWIDQPAAEGWWTRLGVPGSVEEFYQSNRWLQVRG